MPEPAQQRLRATRQRAEVSSHSPACKAHSFPTPASFLTGFRLAPGAKRPQHAGCWHIACHIACQPWTAVATPNHSFCWRLTASSLTWVPDLLLRLCKCVDVDVEKQGFGHGWVVPLHAVLVRHAPQEPVLPHATVGNELLLPHIKVVQLLEHHGSRPARNRHGHYCKNKTLAGRVLLLRWVEVYLLLRSSLEHNTPSMSKMTPEIAWAEIVLVCHLLLLLLLARAAAADCGATAAERLYCNNVVW